MHTYFTLSVSPSLLLFRKKILPSSLLSFTLLSLSMVLTGCGSDGKNTQKQEVLTNQQTVTHVGEKPDSKTVSPLAVGSLIYSADNAKKHGEGKTLTVYSYDSFTSEWGPAPKLKEAFEKDCACTIKFVPFEDGVTMFNRLRLEGNTPKADVIIGLDNNLLKEAEKSHLFAKTELNLSNLNLPIDWKSQTFIPYDYGQYAFIYNKDTLKNPPQSLRELVESQEISVIYQDPRTSTVGRGLLTWINNVYGEEQAEKAWNTLAKHTVTIGKGWTESYGAFLKGESDMVLSYNTSPLYHQINENKDNYVSAEFTEGHIVQIEVASQLKASDTPELAQDFLAFLITPEAQQTISLNNIMLPVINTEVHPKFDVFIPYKTLQVPTPENDANKAQIKVWQTAVSK